MIIEKLNDNEFLKLIQRRLSEISIGSSALRNQGAKGIIRLTRDFCYNQIKLDDFKEQILDKTFSKYIDKLTTQLVNEYPIEGKSWGAARKGLNLFFRELVYNHYVHKYLNLPSNRTEEINFLNQLEVPLDNFVAKGLKNEFDELPKWNSIKNLTPVDSRVYQKRALDLASKMGFARIDVDLEFWRSNK